MSDRDTRVEEHTIAEVAAALPSARLAQWLAAQRWSGAKGRAMESVAVADALVLDAAVPAAALALVDATFADDASVARYAAPLSFRTGGDGAAAALGLVARPGGPEVAVDDATDDAAVPRSLALLVAAAARRQTAMRALVQGRPTPVLDELAPGAAIATLPVKRLAGEQSNTSYVLGDKLLFKLFRRLRAGPQPDVEVPEFLTRVGFPHVPRVAGSLVLQAQGHFAAETTVATLAEFVPGAQDAWAATLARVRAVIDGGRADEHAESMARLGDVTAAMHAALASDATDATFRPEALAGDDGVAVADSAAGFVAAIESALAGATEAWPAGARERAAGLASRARAAMPRVREAAGRAPEGLSKIRVHGDYHLGQVLAVGERFMVIDFEGEPARSLEARRARACALRDVAGMLRSISYAAHVALRDAAGAGAGAGAGVDAEARAGAWEAAARRAFLDAYRARVRRAAVSLVPADEAALQRALGLYELEKALYEVVYEIGHRPGWVDVPVAGATRALEAVEA